MLVNFMILTCVKEKAMKLVCRRYFMCLCTLLLPDECDCCILEEGTGLNRRCKKGRLYSNV